MNNYPIKSTIAGLQEYSISLLNSKRQLKAKMQVKESKMKPSQTNSIYFGVAMITLQFVFCFVYGFCIEVPSVVANIGSVVITCILTLCAIAGTLFTYSGFSLYYSHLKFLIWSSLGFSLLMMALSMELYPLINAFWAKAGILDIPFSNDSFSEKQYKFYLSNRENRQKNGSSVVGAIRCGIAMIVAFSGVIGRVGQLQCLIISVIGCILYELNRQIIASTGIDWVGSFSIFTFGGYMGLTLGIIMKIRQYRNNITTVMHKHYIAGLRSTLWSLVGSLLLIILLALLGYVGDGSMPNEYFFFYHSWTMLLSMASSVVTTLAISALWYGNDIRVRQLQDAVLGGAVVCGASTFFITFPLFGIVEGIVAALVQFAYTNLIERRMYLRWGPVTTYSFSVYIVQGFISAIFAAGFSKMVADKQKKDVYGFDFLSDIPNYGAQFGIYFISAGLGIGAGLISGLLCYSFCAHEEKNMFGDLISWYGRIIPRSQDNRSSLQKRFSLVLLPQPNSSVSSESRNEASEPVASELQEMPNFEEIQAMVIEVV